MFGIYFNIFGGGVETPLCSLLCDVTCDVCVCRSVCVVVSLVACRSACVGVCLRLCGCVFDVSRSQTAIYRSSMQPTKQVSSEQQPMTAQLPFGVGVVAAGSGGGRPM